MNSLSIGYSHQRLSFTRLHSHSSPLNRFLPYHRVASPLGSTIHPALPLAFEQILTLRKQDDLYQHLPSRCVCQNTVTGQETLQLNSTLS